MMDKRSVIDLIHSLNVSEDILVLDGSLRDGYCVRRNGHCWEVLVRERGTESDVMGFPSEEDALRYLAEMLMRTYREEKTVGDNDDKIFCVPRGAGE